MSKGVNQVLLIGNLGQDVELRRVGSNDTPVTDLRLATNERRKQGDEWVDHTEWHTVTVWGKAAENAEKFLSKGSQICVRGKLQTDKWQDKEGNDRYSTKIVADFYDGLVFLSGGERTGGGGGGHKATNPGEESYVPPQDDEIPF